MLSWAGYTVAKHATLLWLGLAFVLAVYFAPTGIVGALRADEAKVLE